VLNSVYLITTVTLLLILNVSIFVFCSTPAPVAEGDGVGNPVGELQELTQKKLMKPPIYEFTSEQGPPHAREFVCIVKLGKIQEKGTGLMMSYFLALKFLKLKRHKILFSVSY
jgi:hypothetical protein